MAPRPPPRAPEGARGDRTLCRGLDGPERGGRGVGDPAGERDGEGDPEGEEDGEPEGEGEGTGDGDPVGDGDGDPVGDGDGGSVPGVDIAAGSGWALATADPVPRTAAKTLAAAAQILALAFARLPETSIVTELGRSTGRGGSGRLVA